MVTQCQREEMRHEDAHADVSVHSIRATAWFAWRGQSKYHGGFAGARRGAASFKPLGFPQGTRGECDSPLADISFLPAVVQERVEVVALERCPARIRSQFSADFLPILVSQTITASLQILINEVTHLVLLGHRDKHSIYRTTVVLVIAAVPVHFGLH